MTLHVAVAGWLLTSEPSGASRRLKSILKELPPMLGPGERVTVLHGEGCVPSDLPAELNSQAVSIPTGPLPLRAWHERRKLPGTLSRMGANVLEQGFLPVASGLPCPISLTVHDLRDLHGWRRRPPWVARRVLRGSLKRSGHITVPSHFTERELHSFMGSIQPHVTVIPGGVDSGFAEKHRSNGSPRPYLLHVGHLETRKNLMLLLSAYARFMATTDLEAEQRPDLLFVGADHGMLGELRERAASLNLSDRVRFCGVVSDERLGELYVGSRAVVVPSLYEGFGLPALEGMAAGRAVLVSDCGALPEIAGSQATVLPSADAAAWADAMDRVTRDQENGGLQEDRRAHAAKFTWEQAAAQTLDVWRQLSRA